MSNFLSGQRLTASDLNKIMTEAEGLNIPNDMEFNKSTGVNTWRSATPNIIQEHTPKFLDTQVRYVPASEDHPDVLVPVWFVYLGGINGFSKADIDPYEYLKYWGIKYDFGTYAPFEYYAPCRIYSLLIDRTTEKKTARVITMLSNRTTPENIDEIKQIKYVRDFDNTSLIDGDLYGWYNTGICVEDWELVSGGRLGGGLYASICRIAETSFSFPNTYSTVLIFSSLPLNTIDIGTINDPEDGDEIKICEIYGGGSTCIASTTTYTDDDDNDYVVSNSTGLMPDTRFLKKGNFWEICEHISTEDPSTHIREYKFVNPLVLCKNKLIVPSEDESNVHEGILKLDDIEGFSEITNTCLAGVYVEFDVETGKSKTKIEKIVEASVDFLREQIYNVSDLFIKAHNEQEESEPSEGDSKKRYVPITVLLINKIPDNDLPFRILYQHNLYTGKDINGIDVDVDSSKSSRHLSSIQISTDNDDNDYLQLYGFNDFDRNFISADASNQHVLVRRKKNLDITLEYIQLSALSGGGTGDVNVPNDTSSINITDGIARLHNFEDNADDGYLECDIAKRSTDYWQGDSISVRILQGEDIDGQILYRKNDGTENQKSELRYASPVVTLPKYTMGDANYGDYRSITSYVDNNTDPKYGLYGFQTAEQQNLKYAIDFNDYYNQGVYTLYPENPVDFDYTDIIVRDRSEDKVDYKKLGIDVTPFVHGDADNYPDTNRKSIDSVTFVGNPDKSYYQLHNFNSPDSIPKYTDLLSNDYVNLANGMKRGSDDNDLVLVRNKDGNLSYRKLYIKGNEGEGGLIERIEHIENNIVVLSGDISAVLSDIYHLSSDVSAVIDNMWIRGANNQINYGSSIGNSQKTKTIDLDNRRLENGSWNITTGGLTTAAGVSCKGLAVQGVTTLEDLVYMLGSVSINEDVECSNIDAYGNVNVLDGGVLKIGNTTINETLLQQLLALLNSSNNILNQQF